ncbi:bifunctional lysylphosphatidylglycerol synthetase/lysine--tRNA ligase LysX [Sciscionella marina]|uniref:bifunctional lysylphosphatidylglycerol synthetase/lysine--tRNA ligase LysX n=1 Tax=Sciscionella marina TaxID=508770 RepID=UPI000371F723|nr:bifunctional lysylphosphatidylglycerol synthetase/lysine--tRNA ligase LysX [Sciscionella marina]
MNRAAAFLATLTEIMALCSFVLAVFPGHVRWLWLPVNILTGIFFVPADASLFMALALALLGVALRRRKRAALWVLLLLQGFWSILAVTFLVTLVLRGSQVYADLEVRKPPMIMQYVLPVMFALVLVVFVAEILLRPAFPARRAKGALRRALALFVGGLVAVTLFGWGLTELFPGKLENTWDRFAWAANQTVGRLITLHFFGIHGIGPRWVSLVIGFAAALVLFAAVVVFFAAVRSRRLVNPGDELRIRELLAEHGDRDSLGYFATRRDKSVVFAPGGAAAVTYRVLGGCSLASGDPIGDPSAWSMAVEAWIEEARQYGWIPCALGASERGARAYRRGGLKAREIGDEAVIEADRFSLSGRGRKSLRQAVSRVRRSGYTTRIRRHEDIPAEGMTELLARADAWRGEETERGFSMALGRLGDLADSRCVMAEAYDAQGELRGLLSFVPWGRGGLSLDVMRRDRAGVNGIIEFLVTEVVAAAGGLGVRRISLNFAMFRAVFAEGERIGAGPVLRAWRAILRFFSRYFQLESLYRSSAKYAPTWIPRFLCYQKSRQLARVSLVAGMAEGFVPTRRRSLLAQPGNTDPAFLERVREIESSANAVAPERQLGEQVRVRMAKLSALESEGIDAYPPAEVSPRRLAGLHEEFALLGPDDHSGQTVTVAGRVVAKRDFGGLCFIVLRDGSGELQAMLTADRLGRAELRAVRRGLDIGDQLAVTGEVITSRTGELSVAVRETKLTAKCLHPLPDKRKGLVDAESRVRYRYLDLLTGASAGEVLRLRGTVLRTVREMLQGKEFLEVETPILQRVHGGANARPFTTHLNAYDARMYLRIAPELYLKRLCVAGVERVFELGRNFRNEGADATHNPEFTMLEAYQAYADYAEMAGLARTLIQQVARAVHGKPVVRRRSADGVVSEVDIAGDWPVIPVYRAVSEALGSTVTPGTDSASLRQACLGAGLEVTGQQENAELVQLAYDKLVEPGTESPTFYTDFPAAVSPLTRPHRADERLAERWDLVAFGGEIGTGYTELTNPRIQRERLTAQSLRAASGDPEAMELDEDFLHALEYGMAPTGGLGLGIDRLVMLLTGAPIRQVITFPFVRKDIGV